jgi:DNA-binding NarL/FixJ family response regulator
LTARELELVALAAQGLSARDMSEQLSLSESTVKSHFTSVYRKLGVSDRAAAVAQAIRRGLIR